MEGNIAIGGFGISGMLVQNDAAADKQIWA